MDPVGSLLKASSLRKGELETRASLDLSTSCGLRRSGSAGLEHATMMPLHAPGTEDKGQMPTSARADKAVSASRQGDAIPDDPAGKPQLLVNPNCWQTPTAGKPQLPSIRSRRSIIHSPSRGEGTPSHNPPHPYWTVLARDPLVAALIGQKGRQVR